MKCKTLLIVPPCGPTPTSYPPYGALYIGTYLQNKGYEVKILNLDIERMSNEKALERIKEYGPDVVGFSAIVSSSYTFVKSLSWDIKKAYPEIIMLMGGQLSYAAKVTLQKTPIDLVIIGEGENTIIQLYEYLAKNTERKDVFGKAYKEVDGEWICENQNMNWLGQIKGIAYKEKNGEIIYTDQVDQVRNLDDLSIPNYELIDMDKYLWTGQEKFRGFPIKDKRFFEPHRKDKTSFTIMTGRGCQAKCSFCTRGVRGLRKHSPEYILDSMDFLIKKYNVGYFTFGDESFISSKRWVLEFLEKLKARNFDVLFYILGARVEHIDRELLWALKDAGCFMIEYGYETGSQRMLDTIEKRTTVTENFRTQAMTAEAGLATVPAFIINLPGETSETISETIQFIKSMKLDEAKFTVKYAQAQPGSPLYEYAQLKGWIEDEDDYLTKIDDVHPSHLKEAIAKKVFFNFSEQPIEEVQAWMRWMYKAVADDCRKRNKEVVKKNSTDDYVKGGEFGQKNRGFVDKRFADKEKRIWFVSGKFKKFLQRFLHKNVLKFKLFGKVRTFNYPVPNYFRDRIVNRLTKQYLNETSEKNSQFNKVIKIKNEVEIKKLAKPLKKGDNGEPINAKRIQNGSFMRCYQSKFEDFEIKRYESLRIICEDIRKIGSKNITNIENAALPLSQDGF